MITTASRFSLLRQLAWAATLAAGFATAWFLVVITLTTWIQNAWPEEKPRAYESVLVRSDGSLIIQNYDLDDPSHITYHDLEGHAARGPWKRGPDSARLHVRRARENALLHASARLEFEAHELLQ